MSLKTPHGAQIQDHALCYSMSWLIAPSLAHFIPQPIADIVLQDPQSLWPPVSRVHSSFSFLGCPSPVFLYLTKLYQSFQTQFSGLVFWKSFPSYYCLSVSKKCLFTYKPLLSAYCMPDSRNRAETETQYLP